MNGLKMRKSFRLTEAAPADASAHVAVPAPLNAHGTVVRTRRGQTIALAFDGGEALFVVLSGALMLHVTLPRDLRQVVALFYPGDIVRSAFAPPEASAHLSAVSGGEVLRLRWSAFSALAGSDPDIVAFYEEAVAKQTARQAVHVAAVGRFDCRQRAATFLLELALRTGVRAPCGGIEFEMPLNRTEMADYLGLNADTLSRTMSHLRATGVLSHPDRQRILVRDLDALAALTPAAPSLRALCGETGAEMPGRHG